MSVKWHWQKDDSKIKLKTFFEELKPVLRFHQCYGFLESYFTGLVPKVQQAPWSTFSDDTVWFTWSDGTRTWYFEYCYTNSSERCFGRTILWSVIANGCWRGTFLTFGIKRLKLWHRSQIMPAGFPSKCEIWHGALICYLLMLVWYQISHMFNEHIQLLLFGVQETDKMFS